MSNKSRCSLENTLLQEWENSELANIIIIGGAWKTQTRKAIFCSGGDVAAIVKQNASGPDGQRRSKDYFALEYRLDQLIATYPKPYIAYMDGYTMGGGVGLSVHAPFRIATENTIVSMPETSIGFFPDVGGSFFLPRLEGYIGTYLALTSNRLNGVNAFYTGIATHYIDSSSLPGLTARLGELEFKDYHKLSTKFSIIDATIEEFGTGIPHNEPMLIAGEIRRAIDRCFRHGRVEDMLDALEREETEKSPVGEWASQTRKTLLERSPTSLKVTLKQMRLGRNWDISEAFQREYHMASKLMMLPDFAAGVTARVIDSPHTTPTWNPSSVHEVQDSAVDQIFLTEGEERLTLPRLGTFKEYPEMMGLPTELGVKSALEQVTETGGKSGNLKTKVVNKLVRDTRGKMGVKEKVEEVLNRKCSVDYEGQLNWEDEL